MEYESLDRESVESVTETLMADFRRKGVDGHAAEDMIQEAWLRTLRSRMRPQRLEAWLRVVGARVLVEFTRKGRSRLDHEHEAARRERWAAPPASLDSKVLRLVEELPEPYAEVVRLRYVEDQEVAEIAQRLRRSEATIRSQLKRGLRRLRARIEERSAREHLGMLPLALLRRFGSLFEAHFRHLVGLGTGTLAVIALIGFLVWPIREGQGADVAGEDVARAPASVPSILIASSGARSPLQPIVSAAPALEDFSFARPASGIVRTPDGATLAGALVFRGSSDGSHSELAATADELGQFFVARVEVSEFLWATDPDFLSSRRVHVQMGLEQQPVDLRLEAPAGRATLCLRDWRGSPLAHMPVELDWDRAEIPAVLMDGDKAVHVPTRSISGLTDFAGCVLLPIPRREKARLRVHRGEQASLSRMLDLVPGDQALDLTLDEPLVLSGHVLDARGRPAAGARVEGLQDDGRLCAEARTDELGRFFLTGLEPGACELRAVEDPAHGTDSAVMNLHLGEDPQAPPLLELSPRWNLRGRATGSGEPLAGARVVRIDALRREASTVTDAQGRFSFPCSVQDEFTLALYVEGKPWPAHWLDSVRPGAEPVELILGAAPALTSLVLEFVSEDPALIPSMIELSVVSLRKSILRPVDRTNQRCELYAPEGEEIVLLAWIPGLGSLHLGRSKLERNEVRRIAIPNPSLITFLVELPIDVPNAPVQGRIARTGFGNPIFDAPYGTFSQYELAPGPDGRTFTARVMPGTHDYSFRAEGLAHRPAWVEMRAGDAQSELVRLVRSAQVEVGVRVKAGERTRLGLVMSDGETAFYYAPAKRREGDRAVFLVDLPPDAIGIVASTRTRAGSAPVVLDRVSRESPASIEIVLTDPSEPGKAVAQSSGAGSR